MQIFYGAGHEQFAPSELLAHARLAEGDHVAESPDVLLESRARMYRGHVLPRLAP